MRFVPSLLFAVALLGSAEANARLLESRHDGFFLRFQVGPGYMSMTVDRDLEIHGGGGSLGIAMGGTIARNLILYGELVSQSAFEPTWSEGRLDSVERNAALAYGGFGPGLAYYLPANFYLSASMLLGRLKVEVPRADEFRSDIGLTGRFSLGKEWWVSRNWGLGLAGILDVGRMGGGEVSKDPLGVRNASLAFSATFN